MICPKCNAVNPEGSKFCHQCGAPLVGAASTPPPSAAPQAPGPSPDAPQHLVVHRHTSPTLWVFVAGVALVVLVLLAGIGAGAYHILKGGRPAPVGPAGVQPRAPGSSPTSPPVGPSGPTVPPQTPSAQPTVPGPTSPAAPTAPTSPAGPTPPAVTPHAPSPSPGPTQPPATPPGPTSPTGPAQPPSVPPQAPGQPPLPSRPQAPSRPASPLPPQPPATAEMQAYRDPGDAFALEYPKTWKVQPGSNGYTVFYQDDPEEGTLFGVFPKLVLNGQATAAQILDALKRDVKQRYPDFEVTHQQIDPADGGELALVDARWTNSRNERMATVLMFWVNTPDNRRSELLLINIQAPEVAFDAVEPTFAHMVKTFLDSLGRQAAR